jgi:hypothetical protein
VEFRNNVIHKGLIPSTGEAMAYAESVYEYEYTVNTIIAMKPTLGDHIKAVAAVEIGEMKRKLPKDMMTWSVALPTMIWLSAPDEKFGKKSFHEALRREKGDHKLQLEYRLEDLEDELTDTGTSNAARRESDPPA